MTSNGTKVLFGFGLLGMGVFLFMKRGSLSSLASSALDEANDAIFQASIPANARPYSSVIKQVASEQGLDPFLLVALVQREDSAWDPNIVTEDGGHGLTQITSDRAWIARMGARAFDPYENLTRGAQMLNDEIRFFSSQGLSDPLLTQAALAAYNHGRGHVWSNVQNDLSPDTGTTGNNYASSVWANFQNLSSSFSSALA